MQLRVFPDAAKNLCSVHFWQGNIEDDDVGPALPEALYRFDSTGEFENFVLILENSPDDQTIVGVIVHDSHSMHARGNNITSNPARIGSKAGASRLSREKLDIPSIILEMNSTVTRGH